jgi:Arc/MetJ-type ribon-helix-helix transcriptional regulator
MDIVRFTVALDESDLRQLDKAVFTLSQKGIRVSRSYIVRALVRSMPSDARLKTMVEDLMKHEPDGRTKKGSRWAGKSS